jgi:hypothetical protein
MISLRHDFYLQSDQSLNIPEKIPFVSSAKRIGCPIRPCPCSPANSVNIAFRLVREFKIDDM